jgi:L-lactate utilization protein LutC
MNQSDESAISNYAAPPPVKQGLLDQFRTALKQLKGDSILITNREELLRGIRDVMDANRANSAVIAGISPDLAHRIKAYLESDEGGGSSISIVDPSLLETRQDTSPIESCNRAAAGITWTHYAIAPIGSLVEIVYDDILKLASSLPVIHIALLPASGILPTLNQALEKIGSLMREKSGTFPIISLISGPSKTSDIELRLLYGVHGPLKLYVMILEWA